MLYQYIACSESGEIVKGKLTAISEEAIAEMLGIAGYRLINLRPFTPFLSLGKLTAQLFPVRPNEVIVLFRQLAKKHDYLIRSNGKEQITNRTLKKVISEVVDDIR